MSSSHKRYSRELKLEVVRRVQETGRTQAEVAKELGISANTLSRWVRQFRDEKQCREAGINVPIIPGIKLLDGVRQLTSLPKHFHVSIPDELVDEVTDSPFFNIFSNLQLGPFMRKEAEELVRTPSIRSGRSLEPHATQLLELAGTLPMHLQIACSALWEHLEEQGDGDPDWDAVTSAFAAEMRPHLEFAWNRASEAERANLAGLARGKQVDRRAAHLNESMRRRGLLCPDS